MQLRRRSFALPLLVKELLEQSARKRTYFLRSIYAIVLLCGYLVVHVESQTLAQFSPFLVFGRGRAIFDGLMGVQFAGIYLVMTCITCGAVTQEKERNTLGLLFLTKLGPWSILFEKLLARAVPMVAYLLISLPLMGFVYALGGFTQTYFWSGCWMLLVAVLQVGAIALACSCRFRTTVGAFIATCIVGSLVFFGPTLVQEVYRITQFDRTAGMLFLPIQFYDLSEAGTFGEAFKATLPALLSAILALLVARRALPKYAFAPPANVVLRHFRRLDAFFNRINNNRITRGIELIKDASRLPGDHPVAWRETTKRSYGTTHYLVRLMLVVELPVTVLTLAIGINGNNLELVTLSAMLLFLTTAAVLFVSVAAASVISGERSRQTLDLLLTTPLSAREILLQKLRGVRRLSFVLCLPPATLMLFQAWWRANMQTSAFETAYYLVSSFLSLAVYVPLAAWVATVVGLQAKNQMRGIIGALLAIVLICIGPFVGLMLVSILFNFSQQNNPAMLLLLLSPVTIFICNEGREYHTFGFAPVIVLLNFAYHGTCLYLVRWYALRIVNQALGRHPVQNVDLLFQPPTPSPLTLARTPKLKTEN